MKWSSPNVDFDFQPYGECNKVEKPHFKPYFWARFAFQRQNYEEFDKIDFNF